MRFENSYIGRLRRQVGNTLLLNPGGRAVLEDARGKVLLHRRADNGLWSFPGGGAEEGESAERCVTRETFEETGLKILDYKAIGFSSDPAYELVEFPNGDRTHGFALLLHSTKSQGDLILSNEESLEVGFFDPLHPPTMARNEKRVLEKFLEYKR